MSGRSGPKDEDEVRADLEHGSIPAAARAAARRYSDREAVVDGDVRCTFSELWTAATTTARAFITDGVQPGDRVAIWAPNSWEWIVALLGAQAAGGVLVPLNTRYKGDEAADILRRSRTRVLCTVNGFLGVDFVGLLAGEDLPYLRSTVLLSGDAAGEAVAWSDYVELAVGCPPEEVDARVDSLGPESVADLIFTSGTTGRPKGVVATHGQALRAFGQWSAIMGLEAGDRYLMVNPMFHTFGYKAGIVACLLTGATMLPVRTFDAGDLCRLAARERATVLPGPPTLYQSLLDYPGRTGADLSSLRMAATGAAVIPTALVDQMRSELGIDTVVTAYGLTEACGFVTACRRGDSAETIASTSGRAIPGVEVKVVDEERREVARGLPGEVVCRGYNVMREYFEDPTQTAVAIDEAGWLHTGDVATMDADGNIRIVDRLKDMYIVGGFNAYPAEIEHLLRAHPAIANAAVVGVPDERLGEVGVAFVVARAGEEPDEDSVIAWAREHMANFKVPREVHVVDALPLNASGKVQKSELRERALAPHRSGGSARGRARGAGSIS